MCSWTFIAARRDRMQLSLYKKRESLCISCVVPRVAGENVPILTKRHARIPSLIRANSSRSGMSREMLSYVSILFCAVLIVNSKCTLYYFMFPEGISGYSSIFSDIGLSPSDDKTLFRDLHYESQE